MLLRILWFMGQIIGYHVSNSFFIHATRGKGVSSAAESSELLLQPSIDADRVSSAAELSEHLLQPSIDADRATELAENQGKIISHMSRAWLNYVQLHGDEFVHDWLRNYHLQKDLVMKYAVDLNEVPFLRKLKDSHETHLKAGTEANKAKLLSCIEDAFRVAVQLDKTTDDSEIKIGGLLLLFAEMTEIEKNRPGPLAQEIETLIKEKLTLSRKNLKAKSPLAYRISQHLKRLWDSRTAGQRNVGIRKEQRYVTKRTGRTQKTNDQ